MRGFLLLLVLMCGCNREAPKDDFGLFTFVGVPIRVRSEVKNTIDGPVQDMVIRVIEVTKGNYDHPNMIYDFDEGTPPPLKIGRRYLFEAGWGQHGMIYFSVAELPEGPIQAPVPTRGNGT